MDTKNISTKKPSSIDPGSKSHRSAVIKSSRNTKGKEEEDINITEKKMKIREDNSSSKRRLHLVGLQEPAVQGPDSSLHCCDLVLYV